VAQRSLGTHLCETRKRVVTAIQTCGSTVTEVSGSSPREALRSFRLTQLRGRARVPCRQPERWWPSLPVLDEIRSQSMSRTGPGRSHSGTQDGESGQGGEHGHQDHEVTPPERALCFRVR
jgi:hypothetical protein